MAEYLMLLGGT